MADFTVHIPRLSVAISEATLIDVLVDDGGHVDEGAPLFLVETEKVETEIPAGASGTVHWTAHYRYDVSHWCGDRRHPPIVRSWSMAITDEPRTATRRSVPFAMRDALHVPRERYFDREFFELEKEHLWPTRVAGGVPVGGDPAAGRLRRVRDLRRLDHRRPPARPVGEGLPQRVPSPRDAAVQGHRSPPRRPDRVSVPRLALESRRHQLVRVRRRGVRARVPGNRRPPAAGVPGRHVGRVRVDQHGSRRPPAAGGAVSGLPAPRRGRRGGHARVVVEGDGGQRQLEDGPGGVPRGLPRDGHAPAAHVRPRRGLPRRQHRVHRVRERPRAVPVAAPTRRRAAWRRGGGPTGSSTGRARSGRARTR